jgi:type II secretory pathway pseudopilin PulG
VIVRKIWKNQSGDTIVEVLIAMTVASSVLGISLSTMNRNLAITRDNQERTEATKIAQGQLEALKAAKQTGAPTIPAIGTNFCFSSDGRSTITVTNGNPHVGNANADTFADYGACKSPNNLYYYTIRNFDGTGSGTYDFYVRWDAFKGGNRNEIKMVYRIKL